MPLGPQILAISRALLLQYLIGLVYQFELKPDVAAIMVATLQGEQTTFNSGNTKRGDNQLSAFIKQVSAQKGKSLISAQANLLTEFATALIM